ncbi:Vta1 like-domain-containing protein [Absidia repens]|uniref:Vta1 like-domain-containing protein n=1 Tax=Absidia repens TaxID=90262 RepID=A0A1X2IHK6_9FUNG|nr:Vta1 like-domain-containing protein [Absidia repens]
MDIPEDLKYLTPYIQRCQELDSRDSIVAYYAYYYAVKLAISRGPSNKTTTRYISHLLDSLEQKKQALGADNEAIMDDLVGYSHVENFALNVFMSADNEDRSGQASRKTAKTFLVASVLLELLKLFGELDSEVDGKIKYAKWKAADIVKAIREGRVPTHGAPGERHDENSEEDTTPTQPTDSSTSIDDHDIDNAFLQPRPLPPAISDFPSPPSNFTAPLASSSPNKPANGMGNNIPSPRVVAASPLSSHSVSRPSSAASSHEQPNVDATSSIPSDNANASAPSSPPHLPQSPHRKASSSYPYDSADTSAPSSPSLLPQSSPSLLHHESSTSPSSQPPTQAIPIAGPNEIAAAQKNAKWAISALHYDDIKTARTQLLDALNDLGYNIQNDFGY